MTTTDDAITSLITALDRAKISLSEASQFLPVSRATLHNWKGGHTSGDQLRVTLVAGYVTLLQKALDQGRLPLSGDLRKSERVGRIRTILTEVKKNF